MRLLPRLTGSASALRQRGAISIIAAAGLTAVIASALLAVDLGNVFYTKRHLQSVADNAALSAVSDLDNANGIAISIAGQNDFPLASGSGNTLATLVGIYDQNTPSDPYEGTFTPGGAPDEQNAVQVTVTTQEPYFFMLGSREITATATAIKQNVAGFSIGSGLLSFDSNRSALLNALLGQLLHTSVSLDALSYNGLANANVRLLDLVKAKADVGTLEELLAADVTVAELIRLTATALGQNQIVGTDLVLAGLETLRLSITEDQTLKLGDLLKVALGNGKAALDAQVNVLQLITLSAQVANGKHFLELPVAVNLEPLAKLSLGLTLVEPPSIAIGPPGQDADGNWLTQAHTAQGRLKLDLKVLDVAGPLLGIHVPLYIELARGDAWLEDIECRAPRDDSTVTIGATSGIASVYIGEVDEDVMTNTSHPVTVKTATLLNVLGLIKLEAKVGLNLPGGAGTLAFNGPFDQNNTQRISGLSTAGLADSLINKMGSPSPQTVLKLTLLGIPLNLSAILDLLLPILEPVLGLLDAILAPVLGLLGIQLGFADITNFYLNCGVPRLVR